MALDTRTLLTSIGSLFNFQRGISIQEDAADIAGLGFRQQIPNVHGIADYNIALDKRDLQRQLDVFSRQISRTGGLQRTQLAKSGVDITSDSAMAIQNATLDQSMRSIVRSRNDQKVLADQRKFQAAQQSVELENRARLAEFRAETNVFQSKQRFNSMIPSLINQIGSLF